jgi:hypothetical protein
MFLKKADTTKLVEDFGTNLYYIDHLADYKKAEDMQVVTKLLVLASNLLDEVGLTKEAIVVTQVLEDCANDPHTKNLTSDKMAHNIEEKGWVFDANDQAHNPQASNGEMLFQKLMTGVNLFIKSIDNYIEQHPLDVSSDQEKAAVNYIQKWIDNLKMSVNEGYANYIDKKVDEKKFTAQIQDAIKYLNSASQVWFKKPII